MLFGESRDAPKEAVVHKSVVHGVHSYWHVPGLQNRAIVDIPIVLRHEIDVMEDETFPVRIVI